MQPSIEGREKFRLKDGKMGMGWVYIDGTIQVLAFVLGGLDSFDIVWNRDWASDFRIFLQSKALACSSLLRSAYPPGLFWMRFSFTYWLFGFFSFFQYLAPQDAFKRWNLGILGNLGN